MDATGRRLGANLRAKMLDKIILNLWELRRDNKKMLQIEPNMMKGGKELYKNKKEYCMRRLEEDYKRLLEKYILLC